MSGFSAEWLSQREPYDLRARNVDILEAVVASVSKLAPVRITDLGCGTGSTLRALNRHLPARQAWRLADNDLGLLMRAKAAPYPAEVSVTTVALDLNRDLEAALDGPIDLVATSALLDLVSQAWLERLAVEVAARSIPLYAALSYDGRIEIGPRDPLDAAVVAAMDEHQRTDKGFGPALGPTAAAFAIARFETLGYRVLRGTSDWVVGPDDRNMQAEIFAGWAHAARDIGALPLADTAAWLTRRRDAIAGGRSSLRVGHIDFFASPSATR